MTSVRDAILHGVGALGALGLAVWATAAPETPAAGSVEIADCGEVTAVRFRSPRRDVDVTLEDGVIWVAVEQRPEQGDPRRRRFRGGSEAREYLDSLSPLVARRSLGVLDGDALDDVGLTSTDERWTWECDGEETTFEVGGRAYGTGDRYIRDTDGGDAPIYLLPVAAIRALSTAEVRLMQRKLVAFEFAEITTAQVTTEERELQLEHRNRRAHDATWVDTEQPSERRRDLDQLMRALDHLSIQEYLEEEPPPTVGIARFELGGLNGELDFIEVRREATGTATYARSGLSDGWVILIPSSAAELTRALERLEPMQRANE